MEGLRRLEYRGYDSAGLAVLDEKGDLLVRRQEGKLINLEQLLRNEPAAGHVAVGHTRWATHGPPCQRNAHPHSSPDGRLVIVHNGIVENYAALRRQLALERYECVSDTDTEVLAHLIHRHYYNAYAGDPLGRASGRSLVGAVRRALREVKGPSAIVVLCMDEPDRLIAARLGNAGGVAVGHGEGEMYIASDIPAIVRHTRRLTFLEDGQLAVVTDQSVEVMDLDGQPQPLRVESVDWDPIAAEKGTYRHFMQKEIYEQGRSLADTLRGRLDFERNCVLLSTLNLSPEQVRDLNKVTIVACGTSYYAGLVGKFMIEQLAHIPVEVDYASELRYRKPIIRLDDMVLAITQSGETVDTLAALEEARAHEAFTAAIVNVVGSQAARVCDGVIYMQAGPEIGVASTKAFTASITDLFMMATYMGRARGLLDDATCAELIRYVTALPGLVGDLLGKAERDFLFKYMAERFYRCHNFLFLGRGINYPIALEGALKLKEISYIHAEGYPAGEMKHGPIALIDEDMPTVVVVPRDSVYEKMISQIEQVKARNGQVIAVAHEDDEYIKGKADHVLPIPVTHELLTPVLAVLPLQLLAYEIAVRRGCDVDQPRNLAKSVTVE
jgi:glucosamine--fructose-6-phosphate aminotransferase (isomerizing)